MDWSATNTNNISEYLKKSLKIPSFYRIFQISFNIQRQFKTREKSETMTSFSTQARTDNRGTRVVSLDDDEAFYFG